MVGSSAPLAGLHDSGRNSSGVPQGSPLSRCGAPEEGGEAAVDRGPDSSGAPQGSPSSRSGSGHSSHVCRDDEKCTPCGVPGRGGQAYGDALKAAAEAVDGALEALLQALAERRRKNGLHGVRLGTGKHKGFLKDRTPPPARSRTVKTLKS